MVITKPPPGEQVDWGNPINRGLVGWWLFNEGAGSRVNNIAGQNNGVLTNMDPVTSWVGSLNGGGLKFDGSNDHIALNSNTPVDSVFTIAVWFKPDTVSSTGIISSNRVNGTPIRWQIDANNTDARLIVRDNAGNIAVATHSGILSVGVWFHLVATRNEGDLKIYIDGVKGTDDSDTFGAIDQDTEKIGDSNFSSPFNGVIDDLRIYNRVLTPLEARQLFHSSYGGILQRSVTIRYFSPATGDVTLTPSALTLPIVSAVPTLLYDVKPDALSIPIVATTANILYTVKPGAVAIPIIVTNPTTIYKVNPDALGIPINIPTPTTLYTVKPDAAGMPILLPIPTVLGSKVLTPNFTSIPILVPSPVIIGGVAAVGLFNEIGKLVFVLFPSDPIGFWRTIG